MTSPSSQLQKTDLSAGRNRVAFAVRWTLAATAASLAVCLVVLGWYYTSFIPTLPQGTVRQYLTDIRRGYPDRAAALWVATPEDQILARRFNQTLALYGIDPRFEIQEVAYFAPDEEKPLAPHTPLAPLRADRVRLSGIVRLSDVPYRAAFRLEDTNRGRPFWWAYKAWRISRIEGLDWLKPIHGGR